MSLQSVAVALAAVGLSIVSNAVAQTNAVPAPPVSTKPGPTFSVADKDLPKKLTLIEYGDMRFTDPANVADANPAARKLLVDKIAREHPDAVQMSGDIPLAGNRAADYAEYATETKIWRDQHLRIYPAMGNHELTGRDKALDLENWWTAFPELRGMRWYSVALGKRVYLLNVDSEIDLIAGSDQRKWIEDQIAHLDKSVDFVLIALHRPPVAEPA